MQAVSELNKKMENKGFTFLEELLCEKNWRLIKNTPTHIIYIKNNNETEYFEITIDNASKKIYVSFPLKNSVYQYKIGFNTYYKALTYIEGKLEEI